MSAALNTPSCFCLEDNEEKPVNVYPEYYISNPEITPEDLNAVRKSWRKIIDSTSLNFKRLKGGDSKFSFGSGGEWLGNVFFENLFELHPAAIYLFPVDTSRSSSNFTRRLTELLDTVERPNDIYMALMELAVKHAKYGVHAVQYGIFGTVLFKSLRTCLGEEYTDYVSTSWIKVYSFILSVVVPIALAEDRQALWHTMPRDSTQSLLMRSANTSNYITYSEDSRVSETSKSSQSLTASTSSSVTISGNPQAE